MALILLVNGTQYSADAEPETPLLWVLVSRPGRGCRSMTHTDRPRAASARAAASPVTPAPMTATSMRSMVTWAGWAGRPEGSGTRSVRGFDIHQVDASLEVLKAGRLAARVEGDDLAVEHQRLLALARPVPQRRGDFWKLACFLVSEPGPEPHDALRLDLRDRPNAVVLRFVDEMRIVQGGVCERRQHGLKDPVHAAISLQLSASARTRSRRSS